MTDRKTISIVTPCYNEEDNVRPCYAAVLDVFRNQLPGYDYEHIFCDNASTDSTPEKLRELAGADPRVKVILNARNFGPLRSTFNGVLATRGDAVLLCLPADLQDPPDLIPELVRKWEEGYEIVYGVRKQREENPLMTAVRKAYYRVVNRLASIYLPEDAGEFQLVDRKVVDALRCYEDHHPYLRGMVASCGFRSTGIDYVCKRRARGRSKASWFGMTDIALNALVSFSKVPLRLCLSFGLLLSAASIAYAFVSLIVVLIDRIFFHRAIGAPGIPTLIIALFFFSGVQLFFLGLLGEYISAIHSQVRKRPLVIERERLNF
jgi:glycosyltransferase involved in cell wall biosynthesis